MARTGVSNLHWGIGALLADGLGDTIRVSLSEAPEAEIPVARKLVDYIMQHQDHPYIPGVEAEGFNYLSPVRRETTAVRNIGGNHLPVVIAERMDGKFDTNPQFIPDYIYVGRALPEIREEGRGIHPGCGYMGRRAGTYPAFQLPANATYGQLPSRFEIHVYALYGTNRRSDCLSEISSGSSHYITE